MVCILRIFDKTILLTVYVMDASPSSNYSGIFIFIMYVCNEVFYELRLIQLKTHTRQTQILVDFHRLHEPVVAEMKTPNEHAEPTKVER